MMVILKENKLDLKAGQNEKYEFVIKAAKGELTFDNIKDWIEKNVK
jgi:prophage maintenance system killer protein